jgi:hypothetical protein
VTGRVPNAGRPAGTPDPLPQPPLSPAPYAPAASPVLAPVASAASPMAAAGQEQEGLGAGITPNADLVAAARRLMSPPSSTRPQIPGTASGNSDNTSSGPIASAPDPDTAEPRSARQKLPNAYSPSSRSSSNLALPPRPLKASAPPLSRSQPDFVRPQQIVSPVGARLRDRSQTEAGGTDQMPSPSATRERPSVSSPPHMLAASSPPVASPLAPRKSFDEPPSSRPSLFDLGLTPRSPNVLPLASSIEAFSPQIAITHTEVCLQARIRVRPEDGRILPQRNRRASLDKGLERRSVSPFIARAVVFVCTCSLGLELECSSHLDAAIARLA